jgi:hypothetical protein
MAHITTVRREADSPSIFERGGRRDLIRERFLQDHDLRLSTSR